MVKWILENLPFEPVSLEEDLPELVSEGIRKERNSRKKEKEELEKCMAQLLPGVLDADGFFFAKLKRKEN